MKSFKETAKKERNLRDKNARKYEEWILNTKGELWDTMEKETIKKAINPKGRDIILDAGCGVGRHSLPLSSESRRVLSIDFSKESVKILQNKISMRNIDNINVFNTDITKPLIFTDCSVDKILCSQVLQHISDAGLRTAVLKEFLRILKPGGFLVLILYRWGGAVKTSKDGYFEDGLYRHAFTSQECNEILKEAGFINLKVRGIINIPKLKHVPKFLFKALTFAEHLIQKVPISLILGKFFIVVGQKNSG